MVGDTTNVHRCRQGSIFRQNGPTGSKRIWIKSYSCLVCGQIMKWERMGKASFWHHSDWVRRFNRNISAGLKLEASDE